MGTYYADFDLTTGNDDGSSWANAFRTESSIENFLEGSLAAGDILYVKGSTLTLDSAWDFSARDGTATSPIAIIGVKPTTTAEPPTYSDWAIDNLTGGTDTRPTLAMGSYSITAGDYVKICNFNMTTTSTNGFSCSGVGTVTFNVKVKNEYTSGTGRRCAYIRRLAVLCEFIGQSGTNYATCFYAGAGLSMFFCRFADGNIGVSANSGTLTFAFCAFENITTHLDLGSNSNIRLLNNTHSTGTTCVSLTTGNDIVVINNIIANMSSYGVLSTTQTDSNFYWRNHMYNNGTNWSGVATSGPYADLAATSGNPKFDGTGDLSLQSDSPCINAAIQLVFGV